MIESILPNDVKYVKAETFFITDASGLIVDPQQILDGKEYRLLCVNASDEDLGRDHHEIYHVRLKNLGYNFLLLTGNINAHDPSRNIYWHQDSYHWSRCHFTDLKLNIQSQRRWFFSCVSRFSRPHRILFYLTVQNKNIWPHLLFRLGNQNPWPRSDDVELTAHENQTWTKQSIKFDTNNFPNTFKQVRSIDDEPYIDAYVNIVLETTCNSDAHTTEKTWKPIAAGQLFLIYGNQHTIKLLRQQGVDTFDDYINHDLYDSEPDARRRCDLVIAAAERLAQQDISKIWHDTHQRRLINQEKFWKGHFITPHFYQLQNTILYKNR